MSGKKSRHPGESPTFGDCADCGKRHALGLGGARDYALQVMAEFEQLQRLDYLASEVDADPQLTFGNLFAERGNMFGVLECVDADGKTHFLRAFSSLADGIRQIDGWVLPVLSAEMYEGVILPAQREIKALTAEIEKLEASKAPTGEVLARRRGISQTLWKKMCQEYRFQNVRGEVRSLEKAILPGSPVTGGMGECCAPKLLHHAACHGLRPVGIAEFYWGPPARPGRRPEKEPRVSGEFYPSCEARCQPILGFLLCGMDE